MRGRPWRLCLSGSHAPGAGRFSVLIVFQSAEPCGKAGGIACDFPSLTDKVVQQANQKNQEVYVAQSNTARLRSWMEISSVMFNRRITPLKFRWVEGLKISNALFEKRHRS
jgi:hypothetical protein